MAPRSHRNYKFPWHQLTVHHNQLIALLPKNKQIPMNQNKDDTARDPLYEIHD